MKILYFVTKSNFCGAQRHVFDLALGAKAAGHDVVVALGGNGILVDKLEENGIKVHSIKTLHRDISIYDEFVSFRKLMEIISDEKPDVIHSHSSKAGILGAFAGRFHNIRNSISGGKKTLIVFTGHGWAFNELRSEFQKFVISLAHWLTLVMSHVNITVSKKTATDVSKLPFVKDKLHVIYNGIHFDDLYEKEYARNIIGIPAGFCDDATIVGIAAELHTSKGHYYALQGLAQFYKTNNQNVKFVLCGVGDEEDELRDLCNELNIEDKFYFAGFVKGLSKMFNAFDIFLLPSITEAFPYVILEAGHASLPTIATDVGGIPEMIDDMKNGILIQSKRAGEVSRAIQFYVENPDKMEGFGKALNSKIVNRFTLNKMVDNILDLYEKKVHELKKD